MKRKIYRISMSRFLLWDNFQFIRKKNKIKRKIYLSYFGIEFNSSIEICRKQGEWEGEEEAKGK